MNKTELINELREILEEYADDDNYDITTRNCAYVSNNVTEEKFYEFDGSSEGAKRGLKILKQLEVLLDI